MRLNKRQQRHVVATLEQMRLEIEAAGMKSEAAREDLEEIDRRITRMKKLLEDEQELVRAYREG